MKSKTSFFNRTLFFSMLRRFWPVFAAYLLTWGFILPITVANDLGRAELTDAAVSISGQILRIGHTGGIIISAIAAIAVAMAAFSYLYNAKNVSMMCSLPIRREGVFVTLFTSGLFWLLACNAVVFLLTLCVEAIYGIVTISALLQWLCMVSLMNIFFFGLATMCASFTGNILVLPAVYVILNFTVAVVEYIVRALVSMFVYGAGNGGWGSGFISWFSPAVALMTKTDVIAAYSGGAADRFTSYVPAYYETVINYSYSGWGVLLIYAAVGLLLAAIGLLLIRRRKMEAAGDVVAVNPLKPVFKYCLSVGCALVLGAAVFGLIIGTNGISGEVEDMLILLGIMLVGAFVGYFAAEMLMRKTLRVFGAKRWIGFGAVAALISIFMFCGEFDVFGYERYVPKADEVESVNIQVNGESVTLKDPDNIAWATQIHKNIIKNKAIHEGGSYDSYDLTNTDLDYYYTDASVRLFYSMKDGSLTARLYDVWYPDTDDLAELNKLFNSDESIKKRKAVGIPVTEDNISYSQIEYFDTETGGYSYLNLTAQEMVELYESCIIPDIDEHALGRIWLIIDSDYYDNVYACQIRMELSQRRQQGDYLYDYFNTTLTKQAQRTLEWLTAKGIQPVTQGEADTIRRSFDGDNAEKYGYDGSVLVPTAAAETVG